VNDKEREPRRGTHCAGSHTFVGVFVFDGVVTQTVTATIVFTG